MGDTVDAVKDKVTSFFKMFGAELTLEFHHDGIADVVNELCKPLTTVNLTKLIKESKPLPFPEAFFEMMDRYRAIIEEYNPEALTKIIFELILEVRPDLGNALIALGDNASLWLYRNCDMARDRIVNPEKYLEELEKAQMLKVTCETCQKSFRIFKEDSELMKMCPFCGATGKEDKIVG